MTAHIQVSAISLLFPHFLPGSTTGGLGGVRKAMLALHRRVIVCEQTFRPSATSGCRFLMLAQSFASRPLGEALKALAQYEIGCLHSVGFDWPLESNGESTGSWKVTTRLRCYSLQELGSLHIRAKSSGSGDRGQTKDGREDMCSNSPGGRKPSSPVFMYHYSLKWPDSHFLSPPPSLQSPFFFYLGATTS